MQLNKYIHLNSAHSRLLPAGPVYEITASIGYKLIVRHS